MNSTLELDIASLSDEQLLELLGQVCADSLRRSNGKDTQQNPLPKQKITHLTGPIKNKENAEKSVETKVTVKKKARKVASVLPPPGAILTDKAVHVLIMKAILKVGLTPITDLFESFGCSGEPDVLSLQTTNETKFNDFMDKINFLCQS